MKKNNHISIRGARQNNLKNLDLDLPLNKITGVTGVSGSGKSSLAFDTLYAEGQRRYVETFSSYARQFLDRMDKPQVDRIEGIPPAIAIDQTNPVRTSRSTVGTMTELNDHLKLLFARAARLHCRGCGKIVQRDSADGIYRNLAKEFSGGPVDKGPSGILIAFPVIVPENMPVEEAEALLRRQGYTRITRQDNGSLEVVQDRLPLKGANRKRIIDDLEQALKHGQGRVTVYPLDADKNPLAPLRFSSGLHCAHCDIHYRDPVQNLFSFNSPMGACGTCRGFGRTIGIDYSLVVPDESKSLAEGAIKPWQTESYRECQDDLMAFARKRGVPVNVPWKDMTEAHRHWALEGEGSWEDKKWYGVRRFFEWLETKSYKMHIRVLLSKYRAYHLCGDCKGARLKPEAMTWRLGPGKGLNIHEAMLLPISGCLAFFRDLKLPKPMDEAADMLLGEVRSRLRYLVEVGLGYLTLDRQSRTLSGGEVQRINLTTALGTSLVNSLFVLDEPSIGLHPRDIGRLIGILQRLRDAGNTLIIVEHDPDVIRAADYVLDMGPGPGERGGEAVFFGDLPRLLKSKASLTAKYLRRENGVAPQGEVRRVDPKTPRLEIIGAAEHNLKGIDVSIPLGRLVCITGVSGSGKSTLIHDVCYNALRKIKGRPVDSPGRHREIQGHEHIGDVVLVDQSPMGKTARSNPASYVGAFDSIRKLFAALEPSRKRGYTAGTFSFNSGNGRCPACSGSGFERVEMQFLSDVYLRCPDCDGRRFRPETLEVKMDGTKSIADVLDMTVSQALEFFSGHEPVTLMLAPLTAVGLSYMKLGQPLPTLSGGEAQRLKLAGHLSEKKKSGNGKGGTLFIFDEPTTGLHFDDIATLLSAFRQLIQEGHSLVVIEHNLDVIAAADWIIDLGPEGGEAGGEIVCEGGPAEVAKFAGSHTGKALREYLNGSRVQKTRSEKGKKSSALLSTCQAGNTGGVAETQAAYSAGENIVIRRAREHNLRNLDLSIPRDAFTVITGVSGSGKSTVAFDILFAEGQRRYLESLNAYARQYAQPASRPDVDGVSGLPPTVAIEQRTSRGGRKSTVATATEIYHFLRLMFARLGTQHCPDCEIPIKPQSPEAIIANVIREWRGRKVALLAPLVVSRKGYYTDLAKWAAKKGYEFLRVDGELIPTEAWPRLDRYKEHSIDLPVGEAMAVPENERELRRLLDLALEYGKGTVYAAPRPGGKSARTEKIFSTSRACPGCGRSFEELDPRLFSFNSRHGWCRRCYGTGLELSGFEEEQTGEEIWWNEWWEGPERACVQCNGLRLRPEALAVKVRGKSIAEATASSVAEAKKLFQSWKWEAHEAPIARDIISELLSRLLFLKQVGLSYLGLDRSAPSLSGGEAQRIRLAAQIGSNLRGVCYILDEPTIGLHARDNLMLLDTLSMLQKKGNTIIVVEHDEETIRHAAHVIDLGPGGGTRGGRLIAEGRVDDLIKNKDSVTGQYLREPLRHPLSRKRRPVFASKDSPRLTIKKAAMHNLKNISLSIPLGGLVCVSGVSGSGKSTLVRDVLRENLGHLVGKKQGRQDIQAGRFSGCEDITGWEAVDRVLEVDQTPIGRTPRSCPATYVGFWGEIRKLFAQTTEAAIRGYSPARFSFNTASGRCPECEGQGLKKIAMSFLPDVTVPCEGCRGARFNEETLAVRFKEKTIAEVLAMNIDEAVEFFKAHSSIHHALKLLLDVGLGYLTLGQQSPTLSGGEAQRIKLVTELARARASSTTCKGAMHRAPTTGLRARVASTDSLKGPGKNFGGIHSLYVLDEPTIGLHMADVEKLIHALHRLVDAGNTVVVIEHNMDVLAEADWVIDLGPEGGDGGGRITAQGTPEEIVRAGKASHTSRFLRKFIGRG
ncbi:MAG: excinuclease ABC subunit UvrA [Nitrospinae bacterium]|nr:excinuclease ABC subunit UvrA [Nitrospinota bacterium]